jgi:uncharacterized protein (TIGR02646 family)
VRYIQKASEPVSFTEWKLQETANSQPNWNDLRKPEKPIVKDALLKEQGYICCYCESRVSKENSHIEHLQPRSKYPDLLFEYGNLMASCQANKKENVDPSDEESVDYQSKPIHCGHHRGDWYDEHLMISPLDPTCTDFFRFTEAGEILPTSDPQKENTAAATIEKLALNINKLIRLRRKAIEGILDSEFDQLTDAKNRKNLEDYSQLDENGRYKEFCSAVIYVLKQNLPARTASCTGRPMCLPCLP